MGLLVVFWGGTAGALEEAKYEVVLTEGAFELRDYAPQVVAEVVVSGSLTGAGNRAFRPLYRYITGHNTGPTEIPMTAPVSQTAAPTRIPMTAPVSQTAAGDDWAVQFMMPASQTLESLPQPRDPAVRLRAIPGRRLAVIRYSGLWTRRAYRRHLARLEAWVADRGWTPSGAAPIWARYNPPFTLWFRRRNEILLPLKE
ncbi:MAG: heme-binding protein [Candidatus Marinimicrobia bacterium]|nr:heme-binding protein [Candidatus Neomarinimicrobiota bacterium]